MIIAVVSFVVAVTAPFPIWIYALGVGAVVGTVVTVAFIVTIGKMHRVAETHLGVPINWRSEPPRRSPEYEGWCASNGLTPYSADIDPITLRNSHAP